MAAEEKGRRAVGWKGILLLTAAAVLVFLTVNYDVQALLQGVLRRVADLGPWAPAAFVLIYAVACVLFLPGALLTLGAGLLFGVVKGTIVVSIASTLGATLSFLIGRYLARDWVLRKIQDDARFRAIDDAVGREGWKIVGLTRLSPVFPFNLLNYSFGLTRVSLKHYFFASWIGMIPGTIMYVYLGSLAGSLANLGGGGERTPMQWALYGVGLAATIAVTVVITRIARKALREKMDENPGAEPITGGDA